MLLADPGSVSWGANHKVGRGRGGGGELAIWPIIPTTYYVNYIHKILCIVNFNSSSYLHQKRNVEHVLYCVAKTVWIYYEFKVADR